ncbi:hypothetical protein AURDEDRAFT_171850 [Auricularia subglabra TFB-10046 SS5]|uniref:Uncharacterized protein n=1 Tax=Auricularia subglabra (strain TFB-10046 / SS5) TaxID=717982 RepID=J0D149_AURST|nr:hypothetical protein AURDEDRAFT_171850 [Auricularia subglabra TFB-10046 SS5]
MGRLPKYKTEEERNEARRRSRREYYERNSERERGMALQRYHAKKQLSHSTRAAAPRQVVKPLENVLPHTVAFYGQPIDLGEWQNLEVVAYCLEEDLKAWLKGGRAEQVWDDLTTRLIAAVGRSKPAKVVLNEVLDGQTIAEHVLEYTGQARVCAWQRRERRYIATFDRISHNATRAFQGLAELKALFNEGGKALGDSYEQGDLIWQCT